MVYWWIIWIGLSLTPLSDLMPPSLASLGQFLLLLLSFFFGHLTIKKYFPIYSKCFFAPYRGVCIKSFRVRFVLTLAVIICLIMMLISLKLSGALEANFLEYFLRIRRSFAEESAPTVTGVRTLDVLTKILFFPLSYSILLLLLAVNLAAFRGLFLICVLNIFCFAYLWQVNYPFIHLFWFTVFYTLVTAERRGYYNKKIIAGVFLLFGGLVASAGNRFGGDLMGGFRHYIIQYHLVGFTYYDQSYLNPDSILHTPSFGRSSLGFIDQVLEALLKPTELGYRSASFESQGFNEVPIDIGAEESMSFNAFGTILFSLYRDFKLLGIVIGGFIYGGVVTYSRYRSAYSWRAGIIFFMLATAWMIGMMVSPLEEVYFWFTILFVGAFGIVNRGFCL